MDAHYPIDMASVPPREPATPRAEGLGGPGIRDAMARLAQTLERLPSGIAGSFKGMASMLAGGSLARTLFPPGPTTSAQAAPLSTIFGRPGWMAAPAPGAAGVAPAAGGGGPQPSAGQLAEDFARRMKDGLAGVRKSWAASLDELGKGFGGQIHRAQGRWRIATASMAGGFERAFDASVGRGIDGLGKGIGAVADLARKSWGVPIPAGNGRYQAPAGGAYSTANGRFYRPGAYMPSGSWGIPLAGAATAFGNWAGGHAAGAVSWARTAASAFVQHAGSAASRAGSAFAPAWAAARRGVGSAASSIASHVGASFRAGASAAGGAARGGSGLGGVAASFALGAIPVVGEVAMAAKLLAASVHAMTAAAEGAAADSRHLARVNGAFGSAYMLSDMSSFYREIRLARETQATAIPLIRGVDHMRDSWAGTDIFRADLNNRVGGFAAAFSGVIGAEVSAQLGKVKAFMDARDPGGVAGAAFGAGLAGGGLAALKNPFALPQAAAGALGFGDGGPILAEIKAAADEAAARAARPALDDNAWGAELHRMAAPGPFLKRPAPKT